MRVFRVTLVLIIVVLFVIPSVVYGAPSSDVGITATPLVSGGITNFTVVYVSDTRMDLSWNLVGAAVNIMIRAKYGAYPDEIPDIFTAPTDGYLVYYGVGLSTSDVSMNFDENPGVLYYRAWAQRGDGTWYISTQTGAEESEKMTLIALVALAGILSFIAISSKNIVMAIVGGGSWWGVIGYIIVAQPTNLENGSNAQQIVILVMAGASVGILIYGVMRFLSSRREREAEINYYSRRGDAEPRNYEAYEESIGRSTRNSGRDESLEDYRARIRTKARPWEVRRRALNK